MIRYDASFQREAQIEDALLELMQKVPYSEITVKDIAEHLQLARKTFYHYFPNKQACLESLADRLIYECNLHLIKTLPESPSLLTYYETRIHFWIGHKDFLDVILRNGLHSFLVERFIIYFRKSERPTQDQLQGSRMTMDEDTLFFYMTGQVFLLLKWCGQGFPLTVEEMALKNMQLVHEPLLSPSAR